MKINYWHYWFEKYETALNGKRYLNEGKRYNIDLPRLLNNFSEYDKVSFKRRFKENKNSDDMLVLTKGSKTLANTFYVFENKI